jgi:hypothetical protein
MPRDSRSVGSFELNQGFNQPRDVPVNHDQPRLNDQRKVRPHAAGQPTMGVRPSGGEQHNPKEPAVSKGRMEMRDVPVKLMTEAGLAEWSPFHKGAESVQGDAIAYQINRNKGTISLFHVKNGTVMGPPVEQDSYGSLGQKMKKSEQEYMALQQQRRDMSINPRRAAKAMADKYMQQNGLQGARVGEYGRDIAVNNWGPGAQSGGGAAATPAPQQPQQPQPPQQPEQWRTVASSMPPGGGTRSAVGGGLPQTPKTATPKPAAPTFSGYQNEGGIASPAAASPVSAAASPVSGVSPLNPNDHFMIMPMAQIEQILNGHWPGKKKQNWTPARVAALPERDKRALAKMVANGGSTVGKGGPDSFDRKTTESTIRENGFRLPAKHVIQTCREMGMHCTHDRDHGEFRVNHPKGSEETAYYTNDGQDAIGTARHMKAHSMREGKKPWEDDDDESTRDKDASDSKPTKGDNENPFSEGYPEPTFDNHIEPAHSANIGSNLRPTTQPHNPKVPDSNREFAQFRDLPVAKVTENRSEMDQMLEGMLDRMGYNPLPERGQTSRPTTRSGSLPRERRRFI